MTAATTPDQTTPTGEPERPAMPTHITLDQLRAACEVLGFDPNITAGFNLKIMAGVHEVRVVTYDLDDDGRRYIVGDTPAMNTTVLPVVDVIPVADAAPAGGAR